MITYEKIINDTQLKIFAQVSSQIWHEYFGSIISNEQIDYMVARFQSYEAVKTQIADGYEYYFIKKEDEIAGYTGFCPKSDYLFLSKLYVKKELRNSGVGRKTLGFIIHQAKEKKLLKIKLTVNKYNEPTIAAYKKWGFETVEDIVTDIGNGFVMDDFVMELGV